MFMSVTVHSHQGPRCHFKMPMVFHPVMVILSYLILSTAECLLNVSKCWLCTLLASVVWELCVYDEYTANSCEPTVGKNLWCHWPWHEHKVIVNLFVFWLFSDEIIFMYVEIRLSLSTHWSRVTHTHTMTHTQWHTHSDTHTHIYVYIYIYKYNVLMLHTMLLIKWQSINTGCGIYLCGVGMLFRISAWHLPISYHCPIILLILENGTCTVVHFRLNVFHLHNKLHKLGELYA